MVFNIKFYLPSISKSVSQSSSSSLPSTFWKKSSPSGDNEPEDSLRRMPVGGLNAAYNVRQNTFQISNKCYWLQNVAEYSNARGSKNMAYLKETKRWTRSTCTAQNHRIFIWRWPNRSRNSFRSYFHSLVNIYPSQVINISGFTSYICKLLNALSKASLTWLIISFPVVITTNQQIYWSKEIFTDFYVFLPKELEGQFTRVR